MRRAKRLTVLTHRDGDASPALEPGERRARVSVPLWRRAAFLASMVGAACVVGMCCVKDPPSSGRTTLIGPRGMVKTLLFRPDGAALASVGYSGWIVLWDIRSGQGQPLPRAGPEQARCAAFSPDGRLLAAGRAGGPVTLYGPDPHEPDPLFDPSAATAGARCAAFAPDGGTLAVGQGDGRITLWDVATRRMRTELRGHAEVVTALAYAPDGQTLASSGGDRTVRLWDPATDRERRVIPDQVSMLVTLTFSPEGRTLALSNPRSRTVRLWDVNAGAERAVLNGAQGPVLAVAISPDGQTLVAADYCGTVHSWQLATGRLDRTRLVHPGVQTLSFAPDGRILATGGFDGTIHLWDWPRPD